MLSEKRAYEFLVRVESDPGEAMANVPLAQGGRKVGTTGENGLARLRIVGREGERATLRATCPQTHVAPTEASVIVLRTYVGKSVPEVSIRCPPRARQLAVVVRAKNGANLDLVHRGKTIGHTDGEGVTHLLLEGFPGRAFEVSLDTSNRQDLRPQNPGTRFVLASRDEALLFDPEFEIAPKKVARGQRIQRRSPLPVRIH